jgi:molecular chaperone DnaJ
VQQACPRCHGSGEIIDDPCKKCHGQGRVRHKKKLSVKIPAGIDKDDRIRLSGEGEAGLHGGRAGDLFVEVHIKAHSIFKREDEDLFCEVPVSFITLTLGGEIEVPTLEGLATLKIPAETQTGKAFRLRGKGVSRVRSTAKGDLICTVIAETPVKLTEKQRELLHEFEKSLEKHDEKHHPEKYSWLGKIKKFLKE